ncbi:hypothetical protein ACFX1X_026705 [Malus domestica]
MCHVGACGGVWGPCLIRTESDVMLVGLKGSRWPWMRSKLPGVSLVRRKISVGKAVAQELAHAALKEDSGCFMY